MRRKQREEEMEEDLTEEAIVSKIYDELKSRSFVEQLRLECIADVKKKETYMKLQDRIKQYLTKKMSGSLTDDEEDFNTDVFRGQIVECGVLAITVERIVDAVVTRKLHEELKPMISKMVKDFCRSKLVSKTKHHSGGRGAKRNEGSFGKGKSLEDTTNFVRKVCDDTQRDSKKIFEDSFISKSLAHVFNSDLQDSDEDMSNLSSNEADNSCNEEEEEQRMRKKRPYKKRKIDQVKQEEIEPDTHTRVRRERKFNPKYSPSLFHTTMPSSSLVNGNSPLKATNESSPIKNSVVASNLQSSVRKSPGARPKSSSIQSEVKSTQSNGIKAGSSHSNGVKGDSSPIKKEVNGNLFKSKEVDTFMYFAKKSSPKPKVENVSKKILASRRDSVTPDRHSKSSTVEDSNSSIRKSGRSRKLNSMIFSDSFQGSPSMDNVLAPKSLSADFSSGDQTPVKTEVEREGSEEGSIKSEQNSSKRYDASDLYKPRPVIQRSRRV